MKRIVKSLCPSLGLFIVLTGCTSLAPRYTQPAAPVPDAWPAGPAYQERIAQPAAPPAADLPWQEFFADEQLRGLIGLTLENNRDLRIAVLNIERARAQHQIQRAELVPQVNGNAGASIQRLPAGQASGTGAAG